MRIISVQIVSSYRTFNALEKNGKKKTIIIINIERLKKFKELTIFRKISFPSIFNKKEKLLIIILRIHFSNNSRSSLINISNF